MFQTLGLQGAAGQAQLGGDVRAGPVTPGSGTPSNTTPAPRTLIG